MWESIRPLLQAAADDPARFEGVTVLGFDEHVWHDVNTKPVEHGGRGPKELTGMVDEVRRRVQQELNGHRGRKNDPLYRIRNILRPGQENLTDRQRARLAAAFAAHEAHVEVELAWQRAQHVRSVYHQPTHAAGCKIAEQVLRRFATCPIGEVARLGRALSQWRTEFLGYFDTAGASNGGTEAAPRRHRGGTEAMNGLIELHRRIARGFRNRDNYRLRMLLIGGGLNL